MHILDARCSDRSEKAVTFHHCSLRAKDFLPLVKKETTATQWVKQYLKPKQFLSKLVKWMQQWFTSMFVRQFSVW